MKIRKMMLLIMVLIISLSTLSGCYFFPEEEEVLEPPALQSGTSEYVTSTVKRGNIVSQSIYNGYVVAAAEYELSFGEVSGKLEEIYVKAGQAITKGQLIAKLDTADAQNDLELQQLYVNKAQIAYNKAVSENQTSADIETARLNLQIEQTKLRKYKEVISGSSIYATSSGLVSFVDSIAPGEYVESHKTLVKLIDSSKVMVKYEAGSVSQFTLGQEVTLRYDNVLYKGVISDIPPQINTQGAVNSVYATFVNETPSVDAIGKIGDIIVVHDTRENVITISKQFVKTYDNQKYVYILKDGQRTQQFVEVGLESNTECEIISGLNEGDLIIIS